MAPSLPTLLLQGKLVANRPEDQERLDQYIPYEYILEHFSSRLHETGMKNRVVIIKSETASGKSTLLPPEIYRRFVASRTEGARNIICTQPRILTAIENVNEILVNYNKVLKLGETIGWSTKEYKVRIKKPGLISATVGTLAQELVLLTDEEICQKYAFILIDETHERDIDTDMAIMRLKGFLLRQQHNVACPFVVLMSATFAPEPFFAYFDTTRDASFIWCRGAPAGFTTHWPETSIENYIDATADQVTRIITDGDSDSPEKADILAFLPGASEIDQVHEKLEEFLTKRIAKGLPVFKLLTLTGDNVRKRSRDYIAIMAPLAPFAVPGAPLLMPTRRVILATNVAETGLTLSNLKYVIDAGFNREQEYNSTLNIGGLITKFAPKSRIEQRRGRAGRKFPGVFYPLYTEKTYARLPLFQFPAILTGDVMPHMLSIIGEQIKRKKSGENSSSISAPSYRPEDIDMVDAPSPDALMSSAERLYTMGALSPTFDEKNAPTAIITPLGELIMRVQNASIGLRPESVRSILAAFSWDANVLDVVTMMCKLDGKLSKETSGPNWDVIYDTGLPQFKGNGAEIHALIADDFIDVLVFYYAICNVMSMANGGSSVATMISALDKWCLANAISPNVAMSLLHARESLAGDLLKANVNVLESATPSPSSSISLRDARPDELMNVLVKLKWCIYDGYKSNLCLRCDKDGRFKRASAGTERSATVCNISAPKTILTAMKAVGGNAHINAFVCDALEFKFNINLNRYLIIAPRVSVLDGFVNFDE